MDTNEIITTEEVIDIAGEITTAGSGNGFKIAGVAGVVVLGGVLAYKYIINPRIDKIKNRREPFRVVYNATESTSKADSEGPDEN